MLTTTVRLALLLFAAMGFAGTGAALVLVRQRALSHGRADNGMLAVGALLFVFAALCSAVSAGVIAVIAFGGVVIWVSYIAMARHVGLFSVEVGELAIHSLEREHERY
jgi:hypothetical protein